MTEYARVTAKPTVDNPSVPPIYFDALLSSEQRILEDHVVFGFEGELDTRTGDSWPFRITSRGEVDFGVECKAHERFGETNIRSLDIKAGTLFRWAGSGYDERFRISDVKRLDR